MDKYLKGYFDAMYDRALTSNDEMEREGYYNGLKEKIFIEGYVAQKHHIPPDNNPYEVGHIHAAEWFSGWKSANIGLEI